MCEKDPLGLGCKSTFLEGGGLKDHAPDGVNKIDKLIWFV